MYTVIKKKKKKENNFKYQVFEQTQVFHYCRSFV